MSAYMKWAFYRATDRNRLQPKGDILKLDTNNKLRLLMGLYWTFGSVSLAWRKGSRAHTAIIE